MTNHVLTPESYDAHIRDVWPKWDQPLCPRPLRVLDWANDHGGALGLANRFASFRADAFRNWFPAADEQTDRRERPTVLLTSNRLGCLLMLFAPLLYGRDFGALFCRRSPPRLLDEAARLAKIATYLEHLRRLQEKFDWLQDRGGANTPVYHDPALLVAISLLEGGSRPLVSDHHRGVDAALTADLQRNMSPSLGESVERRLAEQDNKLTFTHHGLDHVGPRIAQYDGWDWIPDGYNQGGSWQYHRPTDQGRDPLEDETVLRVQVGERCYQRAARLPDAARRAEALTRLRRERVQCYPDHFYGFWASGECKCTEPAVVPEGDLMVLLGLELWHISGRLDERLRSEFGEGLLAIPRFYRRVLIAFAFGAPSLRPQTRAVRNDRELDARVERMRSGRPAPQQGGRNTPIRDVVKFLEESAEARSVSGLSDLFNSHVLTGDGTPIPFGWELYAQFAYGQAHPNRDRFWRAYSAELLDEEELAGAPPPP